MAAAEQQLPECPYQLETSTGIVSASSMSRRDFNYTHERVPQEDDAELFENDGLMVRTTGAARGTKNNTPQQQHYATISASFFGMGLLNNASYCLMLACAKNISEGGTALVFLATVIPSMTTKASAPYWFHCVSYKQRLRVAAYIMGTAFLIVAASHAAMSIYGQLMGVAIMAVQGGLGEASLLALAGKLDHYQPLRDTTCKRQTSAPNLSSSDSDSASSCASSTSRLPRDDATTDTPPISAACLTSFSSGTGLSGVFAFFWKIMLTQWFGWSLEATLLSGVLFAVAYHLVFFRYLASDCDRLRPRRDTDDCHDSEHHSPRLPTDTDEQAPLTSAIMANDAVPTIRIDVLSLEPSSVEQPFSPHHWTLAQRFDQICALWPYTIPLFTVYAAEYACMSGAWTAIGFPVTDVVARNRFYTTSNWLYQVGVFVSRSSGTLFTVSLPLLWALPLLQCANLVLFVVSAATLASTVFVTHDIQGDELVAPTNWLYSPMLFYGVCLYTGLLGGAVYVHGYKRIVLDKPPEEAEFALAATSVAESIGVLVADITGLFMQSCLYKANGLSGAVATCPF